MRQDKASYCIIVLQDAQILSEIMYILLFLFLLFHQGVMIDMTTTIFIYVFQLFFVLYFYYFYHVLVVC